MIIRVFEAFAGYGSQMMALRRVARRHAGGADFQLVGWSEIDDNAIAAHNAVFPEYAECNHGDISKVDWERVSDFDLFTYSFPCQDISNAGLQRGLREGSGSRSSLLWECRRAIETKRPSFLLLENVAALVSKKFMPDFQRWIDYLDEQGYKTYWKKINAKDFGVPQNRVRVFALSIRKDASAKFPQLFPSGIKYDFPQPFPLERRLRDILVTYHDGESVEERYYLKTEVILGRLKWNAESVGSTLTSARPNNVYGDTFPYRIRRLTPRECFRLMDVDDEDYDRIKNYVKGHRKNGKPMYISESQQYKLAGNSIVVACMEHIFEQLFFPSGRVTEPRQLDIFDII